MASFVLERELFLNVAEKSIIKKRLNIARQIYNACLGEALKRLHKVQIDEEYRTLLKEEKSRERSERLREIERSYGYSEYQLHAWSTMCKKHFLDQLGINEVQKLATRAFRAVEKVHYHKAKRVKFKNKDEMISIENKTNDFGLCWRDGCVQWGKALRFNVRPIKKNDVYAMEAMTRKTKYIRIVPKVIRGKERFFVQLVQDGVPPQKASRCVGDPKSCVGIDPGTATMAVVSESHVELAELAPDICVDEKKLRRIQRAMDRSKRATNPENYNEDGTIKKGRKRWSYSNRYRKLAYRRKELYRKIRAKRKLSHEVLANRIVALGLDIRTEQMQYRGLQRRAKKTTKNKSNGKTNKKKRFGKSLGNRAPAMLLTILDRKLSYYGCSLKRIETAEVKASQFDHITKQYTKKELSDRWTIIDGRSVQRDLYSAFLIANTTNSLTRVNTRKADQWYSLFLERHDQEVENIRQNGSKTLKWYVT